MVGYRNGAIRIVRRAARLSVLFLAAPLAALAAGAAPIAGHSADSIPFADHGGIPIAIGKKQPSDAPPKKGETATSTAVPAEPPTALNLRPPLLVAEATPEIVVEASTPGPLPSATNTRCGIAAITRLFVHPADAWRDVVPLPADSDPGACLRSEAVIEHVPEALASVRWYQ